MNITGSESSANGRKIGVGLIGCGARLRYVMEHVIAHGSDLIDVRAICDPSAESLAATKQAIAPNAVVVDDYRDLVKDPSIDWVMVGSWNCFHREHVLAAFEAGKNVFCEKPLATTIEDCLAMRAGWRQAGTQFMIGFTLRYSPHYRKIHELLNTGAIGQLISMEFNETLAFSHGGYIMGNWRRDALNAGTHLLEKCSHDIDLANWFTGSRAARVASFAGLDFFIPENAHHRQRLGRDEKGKQAYASWDALEAVDPFSSEKSIADNQVAIIEYESGVRATFHTNMNVGIPERRMYLCGTEGSIRADVISGQIEVGRIGFDEKIERIDLGIRGSHGGGDAVLGLNIVNCMKGEENPYTGLDHGLISAFTCFAIDEAVAANAVVPLAPYWAKL